jgi:2-polyprenyl-6-methoxyphenol hydroxylase-like FAD-dependent oxidoreductase
VVPLITCRFSRLVGPCDKRLGSLPPAEWKRQLIDLFAEDAGPACDVISATTDEIAAFSIHDTPVVLRWHRGRMVILGDAAHATSPSSGQGASLAIEDAIVLAKCLRDRDDVAQAFATYERLRRLRVERVVAYSARIGQSKTVGTVGGWIRDLVMPFALKTFARVQRSQRLPCRLRLRRLRQRQRVGARGKSELPGRVVGGTPHCVGHVGLGRHRCRPVRQ